MCVTGNHLLWYLHCPAVPSTVLFNTDTLITSPMDLPVMRKVEKHSSPLRGSQPKSQWEVKACKAGCTAEENRNWPYMICALAGHTKLFRKG